MAKSSPLAFDPNANEVNLDSYYNPSDPTSTPMSSPLENAVRQFLTSNATNNNQNGPIQTAQIGPYGSHILVKNQGNNWADQVNGVLAGMGQQYLQQKQMQNRQTFIQGVHQIMSTSAPREDKMEALLDLQSQHGTDYGIGINDIADKLGLNKGATPGTSSSSPSKSDLVLGKFQLGGNVNVNGKNLDLTNPDDMHSYAMTQLGPNYDQKYPEVAQAIIQKVQSLVPQEPISPDDIAKMAANAGVTANGPGATAPGAAAPAPMAGAPAAGAPGSAPAPAMQPNGQPAPVAFNAGDQRVINGMIYTRNVQGQWIPTAQPASNTAPQAPGQAQTNANSATGVFS